MSHATPPVPPGALFYKLLEADGLLEAGGLTRSRSVEHECEKLVSLPASLAASNTVAALHSAVASVVPGNPYLQEAELHADSEERLHYLGRALEAAGVASALRSLEASHAPAVPIPGSPRTASTLRALIADPASPARAAVLAEMQAALAQFGEAFAARAVAAAAAAGAVKESAGAKEAATAATTAPDRASAGAPLTPTPVARRNAAAAEERENGDEDNDTTRASAVESVRARLQALSSPTGGLSPASQAGRVKVRLPERPPVA